MMRANLVCNTWLSVTTKDKRSGVSASLQSILAHAVAVCVGQGSIVCNKNHHWLILPALASDVLMHLLALCLWYVK